MCNELRQIENEIILNDVRIIYLQNDGVLNVYFNYNDDLLHVSSVLNKYCTQQKQKTADILRILAQN